MGTPTGAPLAFLEAAAVAETDTCILWPYAAAGGAEGRRYGRLYYEGRPRQATHVVMELAGLPVPRRGEHGRHLCGGSTLCVNPRHLRAGTPTENERDKIAQGKTIHGARNGMTRMTDEDVLAIRTEYAAGGVTQDALARRYGVRQRTISRIVRNEVWTHLAA